MTSRRLALTVIVAAAAATACNKNEPAAAAAGPAEPVAAPPAPPPEPVKPVEATPPPTPPVTPAEAPKAAEAARPPGKPSLMDPSTLTEQAPAKYKARFTTSVGAFDIEVERDWAPQGADRFYNMVKHGFFDGARFFRAIKGFMVQFGVHGKPDVSAVWKEARIQDDPVKQSNQRGHITFATAGPNTRTTQVFINFADNKQLDGMGFAPFGKIAGKGMKVVDKINTEYGEGAPNGAGPNQMLVQAQGNAYLQQSFPKLDYVKSAKIVK